jgi:enoyl-CoA hydratase
MSEPTNAETQVEVGTVRLEIRDDIAIVTLDRPGKLNALTPEMLRDLETVLTEVEGDPAVRAVVLASAGDRVFCAGADIRRFAALDAMGMWSQWTRRGHQVFDRLAGLRQPTIAAIDGNAYGGGLEIALACDLRVLAENATLGLTEVGLGTVPGWGGTQRLPQQIGVTRAKQMVLTGNPIDASTALDWGLVNRLAAADLVLESSLKLAADIATRAPIAVQIAKQILDVAAGASPGMSLEGIAAAATAGVADFTEGLSAFTERRPPAFTGLVSPTDRSHSTPKGEDA